MMLVLSDALIEAKHMDLIAPLRELHYDCDQVNDLHSTVCDH
jgi:hypothetical protein